MIALKVIGLSQRPQIIVSRPASMRLAMAISPSRRQQFDRAHLAQIHAHRIVGAVDGFLLLLDDEGLAASAGPRPRRRVSSRARVLVALVVLDDVDAHLVQGRHDVLDLLAGHLVLRQRLVEFVVGDDAALLGAGDQLLDRGFVEVDERRIAGLVFSSVSAVFVLRHQTTLSCELFAAIELDQRVFGLSGRSGKPILLGFCRQARFLIAL